MSADPRGVVDGGNPTGELVWRSNALTSTVHLVMDGLPICGVTHVILSDEDEGGIPCGRCLRALRPEWDKVPGREAVPRG